MDQYVIPVLGTVLAGYVAFWLSRWRIYDSRMAWISLVAFPIGACAVGYGIGAGANLPCIILGLVLMLPAGWIVALNLEALFNAMGTGGED